MKGDHHANIQNGQDQTRDCELGLSAPPFKTYSSARKSKEQQEFEEQEAELILMVIAIILLWAAVLVVWSDIFIFRIV
jgi:hypothetical protein